MSAKPYRTRITRMLVTPEGGPLFCEATTTVEIEGDDAGEFVVVSQDARTDKGIAINPEEWPALRAAINQMIEQCEG